MGFWRDWFKSAGSAFGTFALTGAVASVKIEIDNSKIMTAKEKAAAKAGVDLLAARISAKLDKQ